MSSDHNKPQVYISLNAVQMFRHSAKFCTPFRNVFIRDSGGGGGGGGGIKAPKCYLVSRPLAKTRYRANGYPALDKLLFI